MQRVSLRTLVLMLELLAAVVGFQYVMAARPAKADAIWLGCDRIVLAQPSAGQIDDTTGL
jgi:hypothetical protein